MILFFSQIIILGHWSEHLFFSLCLIGCNFECGSVLLLLLLFLLKLSLFLILSCLLLLGLYFSLGFLCSIELGLSQFLFLGLGLNNLFFGRVLAGKSTEESTAGREDVVALWVSWLLLWGFLGLLSLFLRFFSSFTRSLDIGFVAIFFSNMSIKFLLVRHWLELLKLKSTRLLNLDHFVVNYRYFLFIFIKHTKLKASSLSTHACHVDELGISDESHSDIMDFREL